MSNKLVELFQAIADVVNGFTASDNKRAVTISDIWHFIQDQLNVAAVLAAGSVSDGMMLSGYVLDVYVEGSEIYALVTKSDGKLYKVPVTVSADNQITIGEYQEVVMEFMPVTGRQVQVKRMAEGKVRWYAMPACTAVLNRSGEIDSRALFDSFVEYAERTKVYPELDFFHLGERLVLGRADWVARDGATYCASGLFDDSQIARAAIKSLEEDQDYWGLSIAYLPTKEPEIIRSKDGIEIPVFNVGINRYISLLPENTAASILTNISTKDEVNRMNEKMQAALKKLTGEDEALFNDLVTKIDSVNRNAEGMINREAAPVTPASTEDDFEAKVLAIVEKAIAAKPAPAVEAPVTPEAAAPVPTVDREAKLLEVLTALTAKVDELSKSREAAIAEVLDDLPARIARQKIYRPRASVTPDALVTNRAGVNMAEIAEATLERMAASN